jgi:hypothetical protein
MPKNPQAALACTASAYLTEIIIGLLSIELECILRFDFGLTVFIRSPETCRVQDDGLRPHRRVRVLIEADAGRFDTQNIGGQQPGLIETCFSRSLPASEPTSIELPPSPERTFRLSQVMSTARISSLST